MWLYFRFSSERAKLNCVTHCVKFEYWYLKKLSMIRNKVVWDKHYNSNRLTERNIFLFCYSRFRLMCTFNLLKYCYHKVLPARKHVTAHVLGKIKVSINYSQNLRNSCFKIGFNSQIGPYAYFGYLTPISDPYSQSKYFESWKWCTKSVKSSYRDWAVNYDDVLYQKKLLLTQTPSDSTQTNVKHPAIFVWQIVWR